MVLQIRLSNFFSISEEIVLDMQAASLQTRESKDLLGNTFVCNDERLLKTVAIYGANASGKSNIIKAIRACVQMIFESHNYNENTIFAFTPFKFGGVGKPSRFYIRFLIERVEYEYSFTLTKTEIITEELYYYPNGRKKLVFARDERKGPDKKDIYEFRSAIRRPMDVAGNTSKKTLFVSRASQMDRDVAKDVFRYFNERFILNYFGYNSYSIESLLNENKDLILKVLKAADSDIVDIRSQHELRSLTTAVFDPLNNQLLSRDDIQKPQLKITTFHRNNPEVPFDFYSEESSGTQEFFHMMLTILNIIKGNKVLLIDEISMGLHVNLVEYILNLFHQSESAQLIFSTHNTNLLNMRKLRKDQVYFVNKRDDGSSDLYSLFDFKDFRENMDAEKAYLQGRFDAIPYIDESYNTLTRLG
ncbi:MAG: ATP-binding protein [Prevotella sp.]|nr:ATP-binding protein [Prevotella sp.]MBQ8991234.1 ATP-binding protein [Prevotella sp.]